VLASSAPLGGHLGHALLLASWVPVFALMVVRDRRREGRAAPSPKRTFSGNAVFTQAMAVGCVCAAVVHAAVTPEHFKEAWLYGAFFLALASVQILFAVTLLVRPTRPLVMAGVIGSGLVVAFWLFSRLVGVPVGPDGGATESFGLLDVLASAAETVTFVGGAVCLLRSRAWGCRPESARNDHHRNRALVRGGMAHRAGYQLMGPTMATGADDQ
jgi:hypothetical protein